MYKKKNDHPHKRSSETVSLKDAINDLLNAYKLRGKFTETKVAALWPEVMGKPIASRTEKIYAKNGILYVYLTSAPLKQELSGSKQKIIEMINKELGQMYLEDIVFR